MHTFNIKLLAMQCKFIPVTTANGGKALLNFDHIISAYPGSVDKREGVEIPTIVLKVSPDTTTVIRGELEDFFKSLGGIIPPTGDGNISVW